MRRVLGTNSPRRAKWKRKDREKTRRRNGPYPKVKKREKREELSPHPEVWGERRRGEEGMEVGTLHIEAVSQFLREIVRAYF